MKLLSAEVVPYSLEAPQQVDGARIIALRLGIPSRNTGYTALGVALFETQATKRKASIPYS